MKFLSLIILLTFASSSYAQDVFKCSFTIPKNKVKKDLKELKKSTIERTFDLFSGMELNEKININRIIAHPGEKKTDKYVIRLFEDDKRDEKISEEKEIDIVRMKAKESIDVSITKQGRVTKAIFKSNMHTSTLTITGIGGTNNMPVFSRYSYLKKGKVITTQSLIYVSCSVVPAESILEDDIKRFGNSALDEEARIKAGQKVINE